MLYLHDIAHDDHAVLLLNQAPLLATLACGSHSARLNLGAQIGPVFPGSNARLCVRCTVGPMLAIYHEAVGLVARVAFRSHAVVVLLCFSGIPAFTGGASAQLRRIEPRAKTVDLHRFLPFLRHDVGWPICVESLQFKNAVLRAVTAAWLPRNHATCSASEPAEIDRLAFVRTMPGRFPAPR